MVRQSSKKAKKHKRQQKEGEEKEERMRKKEKEKEDEAEAEEAEGIELMDTNDRVRPVHNHVRVLRDRWPILSTGLYTTSWAV
jgi:hypothetical protein